MNESLRRRAPATFTFASICVAVFLAWFAGQSVEPLGRFLALNFTTSYAHLVHGRPWTLLTAAFSHLHLWHLLFNMMALVSFGAVLERMWGTQRFVRFYLGAALVSSAGHCLLSLLGWPDVPALGASGAISALLVAFSIRFPREKVLVFGLLPVPAGVFALLFVGWDLFGLFGQRDGSGAPIGHGAHLAGSLFGLVATLAARRRAAARIRNRPLWERPIES